ncbi:MULTISPECIES: flagellar basal body P-ring protein FlgI [unclassified Caballeronia]|uniref:flagellar basal body P-ring protein FlgI n=1 Tax=unclassified Caballeronia TaxID=2646786 RepID=UPI00285E4FF2|nr:MULTISPECIES: flagellar basal body P-ring protein FlgI [unclassified Caballeronia]MDR5737177.1 flagellar basal body P-ring protein FlgI [Caballeronia sp. LZ016]MDR5810295.1 flagellar basal body P-ring protein FlgI [Caballeronia sp. LZ019]
MTPLLRFVSFSLAAALVAIGSAQHAHAERLKDLVSFQGVRDNPLIGYGLVVGLDGTGDQTMQTPFTTQSLTNMLGNLGITVNSATTQNMQLKNVAAVMVTATLPPFSRPGEAIDVTVSSLGNAKSLRGGTLLMSPLKGADGQVYAMAQGNLVVGGAGASANGSKVQVNQLAVGRISGGAIVERAVPTALQQQGGVMQMEMREMDFDTTQRVVAAVNNQFGMGTALALDGRTIQLRAPQDAAEQVAFMAQLQNIDVRPAQAAAKVILNARTGSIVMNQMVTLQNCAVAHGNLSVVINTQTAVSQPNALSNGQTVAAKQSQIQLKQDSGALKMLSAGANLADVVKGLNALGATPADLISILQSMKAAGALRADLEII